MRRTPLAIVFILSALAAGLPAGRLAYAQLNRSMSSDEMLQYTLTELKNRLQEVVEDNAKLSNRNNALRKRMLSLRQDMRELENHKLSLMERNIDLKDFLKMDSEERALTVRKIKELKEQDSFSSSVSEALSKAVEQNETRSEKLKATIATVEQDIKGIRPVAKKRPLPAKREGDRNALLARIQKMGATNRLLEKELPSARKKIADLSERKKFLLARQSSIKSQMKDLEEEIDQAAAEEKTLSSQSKKMAVGQDESTQALQAQVNSLNVRHEQMVAAMRELTAARQKVGQEIAAQEAEVKKLSAQLADERQLLEGQKRILLARMKPAGDGKDDETKVQEEIAALSKKLEPLKAENQELKTKIAQQEQEGFEIKNQEAGLQKEITQLKQDMKTKQQRGQQSQAEALKSRKVNLTRLMNEYQARNQALKKQIADRQKQKDLSEQKTMTSKSRKDELAAAIAASTEELIRAQDEEIALRREAKDLEGRQGKGAEGLKAEIDTLELRKTVLMSSLEAIRNKYNQDKGTIQEFVQRDQKELEEYLGVLKAENATLKDKALSLNRSLKGTRRQ